MAIATQAQIASGPFEDVACIAYCHINNDPSYPYRWLEWRDPDNYRWFIKNIVDPNGPLPPYSQPVLCGAICIAAGVDPEGTDEEKIRAAVEALVAPERSE